MLVTKTGQILHYEEWPEGKTSVAWTFVANVSTALGMNNKAVYAFEHDADFEVVRREKAFPSLCPIFSQLLRHGERGSNWDFCRVH